MSRVARRREVAAAQRQLTFECDRWHADTQSLRAGLNRHRIAWIAGGGFAGGLAAGWLPRKGLVRAARLVTEMLSLALRTPLGPLIVEGIRRRNGSGR